MNSWSGYRPLVSTFPKVDTTRHRKTNNLLAAVLIPACSSFLGKSKRLRVSDELLNIADSMSYK